MKKIKYGIMLMMMVGVMTEAQAGRVNKESLYSAVYKKRSVEQFPRGVKEFVDVVRPYTDLVAFTKEELWNVRAEYDRFSRISWDGFDQEGADESGEGIIQMVIRPTIEQCFKKGRCHQKDICTFLRQYPKEWTVFGSRFSQEQKHVLEQSFFEVLGVNFENKDSFIKEKHGFVEGVCRELKKFLKIALTDAKEKEAFNLKLTTWLEFVKFLSSHEETLFPSLAESILKTVQEIFMGMGYLMTGFEDETRIHRLGRCATVVASILEERNAVPEGAVRCLYDFLENQQTVNKKFMERKEAQIAKKMQSYLDQVQKGCYKELKNLKKVWIEQEDLVKSLLDKLDRWQRVCGHN